MFKRVPLAALCVLLLLGVLAAASDPFAGKWKLDVSRSRYPGSTCPRSMVIEMRPAEQGIWYHSDAVYKNGAEIHAQYTAAYDGKEAIVVGDRGLLLPVSLKRLASHTVVASYARGMQVVATSRRVVSPDGRLMIITTTSVAASGEKVVTIGVFQKQ
jgi:hypothetical protein